MELLQVYNNIKYLIWTLIKYNKFYVNVPDWLNREMETVHLCQTYVCSIFVNVCSKLVIWPQWSDQKYALEWLSKGVFRVPAISSSDITRC